jgi:antitoxin MazE
LGGVSASTTGMHNAVTVCYSCPRNPRANIMRVSKWGNSLAVRLPKRLVDEMGLRAGDNLTVVRCPDRAIPIEKDRRRQQALNRLTDMRIPLPPDYKFDRDEANER